MECSLFISLICFNPLCRLDHCLDLPGRTIRQNNLVEGQKQFCATLEVSGLMGSQDMSNDKTPDWDNDLIIRCHRHYQLPEEFVSWSRRLGTNGLL